MVFCACPGTTARLVFSSVAAALVLPLLLVTSASAPNPSTQHSAPRHTSNWAVLVDTSRFWLNYRHESNVLSFYRTIKRLGIPDSNIILMVADDQACNARNPYPAHVFNNESHTINLYDSTVEVDYKGSEVNVENFLRLIIGRHAPATPRSKRLLSDEGSNIFIFLTGHGGDGFIKFQDVQELMSQDLADALQQMYEKRRYNEVLLMVETCEAATLVEKVSAPGIVATGSSVRGESSLSYLNDFLLGQPVVDRFTRLTLDFAEKLRPGSKATLPQLFRTYTFHAMESQFVARTTQLARPLESMRLTDFWGSVVRVAAGLVEPHFSSASGDDDGATSPVGVPGTRPRMESAAGAEAVIDVGDVDALWQAHVQGLTF